MNRNVMQRRRSIIGGRCYSAVPNYIIDDLRDTFDSFDPNSTGYISSNHLQSILTVFNMREKTRILLENEKNQIENASKVSWEQVLNIVVREFRLGAFDSEARDLFKIFDRNDKGRIGVQDIKQTLESELKIPTNARDIKDFIDATGVVEPNGNIGYDDFRYFLSNIQ